MKEDERIRINAQFSNNPIILNQKIKELNQKYSKMGCPLDAPVNNPQSSSSSDATSSSSAQPSASSSVPSSSSSAQSSSSSTAQQKCSQIAITSQDGVKPIGNYYVYTDNNGRITAITTANGKSVGKELDSKIREKHESCKRNARN
jgi:hypothetical protein